MGKSRRLPYGTWVCTRVSEHDLKTLSSRIHRRAQEQVVREAYRDESWDEFLLPIREEGKLGSEYDLRRDGRKHPLTRSRQYNNPYGYWRCRFSKSDAEIEKFWRECQEHDDWYIAYASRK